MWKKFIILTFYLIVCIIIYKENTPSINVETKIKSNPNTPNIKEEKPIGKIIIKKINLYEEIYSINSSNNTIEKHVTILNNSIDPSIENSIMFLAAHSGTGKIAYFNRLNELNIKDLIILEYNNITYHYIVDNIWEQKKDGTISVPKEDKNQLILTTCSPNKKNMQLIISLSRT